MRTSTTTQRVQYVLGTLSDEDLDWLVAVGQRQSIPAKATLIEQGKPISAIYLILQGQFAVITDATTARPVAYLSSGDVAGEMSLMDAAPPSATVMAVEPGLVVSIPKNELLSRLHYDICFSARFYEAMAVLLSVRLRSTLEQVNPSTPINPSTPNATSSAREADVTRYNLEIADKWSLGQVRYDWLLRRLQYEVFHTL
ncbi:MAG: cyclic nucleotide-binding domain-containing protein [Cyanobacteria bacterium J06632_3]